MFRYQLKMAWKSLRRNPILSALLVAAIALGITVSTTFVTSYYVLSQDPIPHKSDVLHYVQMDSWQAEEPWNDDQPEEPPELLTYRDMRAAMASDIPTYQSGMYKSSVTVHPEKESDRPFRVQSRNCTSDFFPMFDVAFLYGGPWDSRADENEEPVIVLGAETNEKLFGGEDSIGRSVRLEDRSFTVVGVIERWNPAPKYYDMSNGSYNTTEEVYLPLNLAIAMEMPTAGNTNGWKFEPISTFADRLESHLVWTQMWVQLDTPEQKAAYVNYIDNYVREQKSLGRFERPLNNRIRPVMEWIEASGATPDEAKALLIIALLFLVVCAVNMIGILLGKFLARAPEIGVRRALGASKTSVFVQHILECELIGLMGGTIGILLSIGTLKVVMRWTGLASVDMNLDFPMIAAAFILSLGAGLVAGLYPAWRICRIAPAAHLKLQ